MVNKSVVTVVQMHEKGKLQRLFKIKANRRTKSFENALLEMRLLQRALTVAFNEFGSV